MQFFHYLIKVMLHAVLHVFWVFPVKKNRITLLNELSFSYGDNLKYLAEHIRKTREKRYELIFPLSDIACFSAETVIPVRKNTIRYFYYLLSSSVIITNAGGVSYLPLRKNQFALSTWHGGGPYKKTGNSLYQNKWYEKELRLHRKNTRYILSSCRLCTQEEMRGMLFEEKACIPSGMPRNDIFFKQGQEARKKVFDFYALPEHSKLVLFAPTFRGTESSFTDAKQFHITDLDIPRVTKTLQKKFGETWAFGIRLHPKLRHMTLPFENVIDCTAYPDMQELLCASDIVITDYSSLMWDFSFTARPLFLYADDIEKYESEHGFYMPSSQWPYPLAHNNDELEQNILKFDLEKYQQAVRQHHKDCGSYENGNACEQTLALIERELS